ncbi:MAG: ornithine carbamoyltransferase [Chloroflexota bacterium]
MAIPFPPHASRFLSVTDLDPEAIVEVLDHADDLKRGRSPLAEGRPLAGCAVALIFQKPSLRTRVSFEVGVARLGGQPVVLSGKEVGLGSRETVADVARTLERYVDAIVARVFDHRILEDLADAVSIPVVNALSDAEHPCQALADLQVLREHLGGLAGKQLVFVGDGNNVAASLLLAGASVGMHARVVCPPAYAPDATILARAQAIGRETGARIEVSHDPATGAAGADAVYTDVWASMGQEDEAEIRRPVFSPFRVTRQMLAVAPDALVLHCLPAHRGEEIDADVLDGPRSIVFDQAENRLWAQMAVLARLVRPRRPWAALGELPEPTPLPTAIGSRSQGRPGPG